MVTTAKGRVVDHPQLTHTLVREVRVDISVEVVRQVLLGSEYMRPTTLPEFDYHMRIAQSWLTMRDTEHRVMRMDLAILVAVQIAKFGTDTP